MYTLCEIWGERWPNWSETICISVHGVFLWCTYSTEMNRSRRKEYVYFGNVDLLPELTILYIMCVFCSFRRKQQNNLSRTQLTSFKVYLRQEIRQVAVKVITKDIKADFQLHVNANLSTLYCWRCRAPVEKRTALIGRALCPN